MYSTETTDLPIVNSDICSQINLLSSIQHQQKQLENLAALLNSEEDREQYAKVIELSKVAQARLDRLLEKRKTSLFDAKMDYRFSRQSDCSDATLVSFLHSSSCSSNSLSSQLISNVDDRGGSHSTAFRVENRRAEQQLSRTNTYHGHPYRLIDRATSIRFQSDIPHLGRRSSIDTIIVTFDKDGCNKSLARNEQKIYVKQHRKATIDRRKVQQTKRISFAAVTTLAQLKTDENNNEIDEFHCCTSDDEDEDEEEVEYPATIHIAIRKDASLITIGKASSVSKDMNVIDSTKYNQKIIEKDTEHKKTAFVSTNDAVEDELESHNVAGMLTPPASPNKSHDDSDERVNITPEAMFERDLPPIVQIRKKHNPSLKGLLRRTLQINQYTMVKGNSTLLSAKHPYMLHTITDSKTSRPKIMLKINIVSVTEDTSERQRRFGLTFLWQQKKQHQQEFQNDTKFSVAPDSLVREALTTWMDSQIEQFKGDDIVLPPLAKADEILRNGRKLCVVYDAVLLRQIGC